MSSCSKNALKGAKELYQSIKDSILNLIDSEGHKNTYMITLLLGCLQNGLTKNHLYDIIDLDNEIIEQSLAKLERLLFL